MILNKDFKEFIGLLEKHEVKYLVVGGYATAYYVMVTQGLLRISIFGYGHPRKMHVRLSMYY